MNRQGGYYCSTRQLDPFSSREQSYESDNSTCRGEEGAGLSICKSRLHTHDQNLIKIDGFSIMALET